jgi:DNA-binding beta-propeller fold protein YncE
VALVADAVYVGGAFPTLYAVDAASGEERWHVDLDGTVGAAPIVSGGIIYVGTETGSLYALGERGEAPPLVLEAPDDSGAEAGPAAFLWQAANGSEPIAQPGGIALAPDGNIWVVEGGASRILIFSPDGVFLEPWGTPGPSDGEFNFVLEEHGGGYGSIGFDREGNIYVLDSGNFRVQKFDRNRKFVTAWGREGTGDGEFAGPVTMTVAKDGNVYVGDDVRGDIQKFDANGTLLDIVGSRGEGDGQFACIPAFGVDGQGNLYVPDCVNNEIQKFGPDGEFVMTWGSEGRGDGQFRLPVTAVVDAAGNVFISDAANSRVQVFAPDGTFLTAWGEFGTGDGQFGETSGLVLDGAGHIYVTDYVHGRLQKFRLQPPLAAVAATPPAE